MVIYQKGDKMQELAVKNGFLFLKVQSKIVNLNTIKEICITNIGEGFFMVEAKISSLFTDYSIEETCKPMKVSSPESLEIETFNNREDAEKIIAMIYDSL